MGAIVRGVLAWIIGAVVAVGVGMLALSRIGYGLTADTMRPLNPDAAAESSAVTPASPSLAAPVPSPSPSPTVSAGESAPPRLLPRSAPPRASASAVSGERALSSPGGTAIVRCSGGAAYLVSWSPEQGYHVDDVRRGPAAEVSVQFEGRQRKVSLSARCVGGAPQSRIGFEDEQEDD